MFRIGADGLQKHGPIVEVKVGFDRAFDASSKTPPALPDDLRKALIDTGSEGSLISATLAGQIGLPELGSHSTAGVHGLAARTVCGIHVIIPALNDLVLVGTALTFEDQKGAPDLLLGRTILRYLRFTYDGAGSFSISRAGRLDAP